MKKLILILGLAMLIPARASWAQVAAPNRCGVSMGHVHLMVQDVDAAKKFWTAMGGVPGKLGPNDVFKFPGVLILVRKGDDDDCRASDPLWVTSDFMCPIPPRRWPGGRRPD